MPSLHIWLCSPGIHGQVMNWHALSSVRHALQMVLGLHSPQHARNHVQLTVCAASSVCGWEAAQEAEPSVAKPVQQTACAASRVCSRWFAQEEEPSMALLVSASTCK